MIKKVKVKESAWVEEDARDVESLMNQIVHISRIRSKINPQKRCISINKHGKTVAFDIEMAPVLAEIMKELSKEYVRL